MRQMSELEGSRHLLWSIVGLETQRRCPRVHAALTAPPYPGFLHHSHCPYQAEGSFVSSKARGELDIVAAAGGGERFAKNTSGC